MELTNFQILLAALVAASVLILNVLKAIKLLKDMRKTDDDPAKK